MTTVTGTLVLPDATPDRGVVAFRSYVTAPNGVDLVTTAPVLGVLDDLGAFSVEVIDSEDPSWDLGGEAMPYQVTIATQGERSSFLAYITGSAIDLVDLVPLVEVPDLQPGVSDHGLLGGLGDDDHTQYLRKDQSTFAFAKAVDVLNIPDTWTEVNALDVDVVAGGTYIFAVSLTWHFDVTNRSALFRFSRDGGQTWGDEYTIEPGDNTDVYPFFYSYPATYAADESIEIVMQARKENANGTLDVSFCDLWLQRVA